MALVVTSQYQVTINLNIQMKRDIEMKLNHKYSIWYNMFKNNYVRSILLNAFIQKIMAQILLK